MRILFVTNNYKPYAGGVVSSIDAAVQGLQSAGHEVIIITLNFLGEAVSHEDAHIIRMQCPIRFMYKNNHMAVPWRSKQKLLSLVRAYKPDLIHVHHPFLLGVSGMNVAQEHGIPCVFTYHSMYEHFAHYIPLPTVCTTPFIRLLVTRFCTMVDGIIAPSSSIKNYLRGQDIIAPIEILPSPLRKHFFESSGGARDKTSFFELLVVSRFAKEKNIPFVFDVFKYLPNNVRLTLAGYGSEYDFLRDVAFNQLGLSPERVRFIHKPEQQVLIELYRNADIFIFPSRSDTQGIVLVEAMSQGLPVVAIDGSGQRDIICSGDNGFIVAHEKEAACVIHMIMQNKVLHDHLRLQACKTAQRYSSDQYTAQLLSFYTTISTS